MTEVHLTSSLGLWSGILQIMYLHTYACIVSILSTHRHIDPRGRDKMRRSSPIYCDGWVEGSSTYNSKIKKAEARFVHLRLVWTPKKAPRLYKQQCHVNPESWGKLLISDNLLWLSSPASVNYVDVLTAKRFRTPSGSVDYSFP